MDLYFVTPGSYFIHLDSGSADQKLDRILAQGDRILMATTEVKAAMARIDKATTDISTRITALIAKVGTGMSEADVAEVQSGLEAEATKLEGIAVDPDQPVPPAA